MFLILLFFLHLFCLNLHLFVIFNFQFLDNLCSHIEELSIEHSIDVLLEWLSKVSNSNHEHQEIFLFQFKPMFISSQLLPPSRRQGKQESEFSQDDQQSDSINNLPLYLTYFRLR